MGIQFSDVTFEGHELTDDLFFNKLPGDLKSVLGKTNGFIKFSGGFHLRGVCQEPYWHALDNFWIGKYALTNLFEKVLKTDIPFGQDCMGDQFLLRDGEVFVLKGESGDVINMRMDFSTFLEEAEANPLTFFQLYPLKQFQSEGGKLEPGQLLSVWPPFISAESRKGVSLKAVPVVDRILFLSDLAKQTSNLPDGSKIKFSVIKSKKV